MLYFARWKAIAILLTAFVVCSFAVPNFLPQQIASFNDRAIVTCGQHSRQRSFSAARRPEQHGWRTWVSFMCPFQSKRYKRPVSPSILS